LLKYIYIVNHDESSINYQIIKNYIKEVNNKKDISPILNSITPFISDYELNPLINEYLLDFNSSFYIDVDIYQSTLDSLNFFYPKMLKGGFMFFDDYMGKNTPGVKKALDEFLIDKKEIPIVTTVGQCVIVKQ
jgi:hypothetical protein